MKFIQPNWPAPASVFAYTTIKEAQLNYQPRPDQALSSLLNLPSYPIWIDQKHTNVVVEATLENKNKIADASFTAKPQTVCIVLTADCLPLLICNKQGTQVAAIHAGWRGLAQGVIEQTIHAMNQPPQDLLVWLGPAIGPNKFEVGEDVFHAFVSHHAESKLAFNPHTPGKWLANLYLLAKMKLNSLGIMQIYGGDFCTYTQDNLFYSYRRDQGKTGRMASLIWLDAQY